MNLEDRAISDLLISLGFQISCTKSIDDNTLGDDDGISLNKFSTFALNSRYFNSRQEYDLICVNSLTKNRAKMSLIVRDTFKTEEYLLIVKGEDFSFRNCFNSKNMEPKELNQYKALLSEYRVKGLKRLVIACKTLTRDEVEEYLAIYNTICDSSREQLEAFESHARKIETDLIFVGCIGVKDIVRNDAFHIAEALNKASIQSNILSGDSLDNCLTLAKEIGLTKAKFNDTSTYFHLSFKTEDQGMRDLRRILENLYETIVDSNMQKMDTILESEKKSEKKSKTSQIKDLFSMKGGLVHLVTEKQKDEQEIEKSEQIKLKKTLLINGKVMPIIANNLLLRDYFKIVLLFSNCIIGYTMKPNHKATVVKLVRELGKTVMAIGDGLNDLGMLSEADVSVQLCNKDVHMALADIQVGDLRTVENLIFYFGAKMNRNMNLGLVLTLWFSFNWAVLQMYYFTLYMYSRSFFNTFQIVSAIGFFSISIIYFIVTDEANTSEFLMTFPIMHFTQKIIRHNFNKVIVALMGVSLVQGYFLFTITSTMMANTRADNGTNYPPSVLSHFAITLLVLGNVFRVYFAVAHKKLRHHIVLVTMLAAVLAYFHIEVPLPTFSPFDWLFADMLGNSMLWAFSAYYLLPIVLFNWVVISIWKSKYFNPFTRIIALHLKGRNFMAFRDTFSDIVYTHVRRLVPNVMKLHMVQVVKHHLSRATCSDSTVQKILSIDFLNYSWPIDWFQNLKDPSERRRFLKVRSRAGKSNLRLYLLVGIVLSALEYIILILVTDFRRNYYLDSPSLYFIFFCLVLIAMSYGDLGIKYTRKIIDILFSLFVTFEIIFLYSSTVLPYRYIYIVAGRLIMGPFTSDFLYLSLLSIFRDAFFAVT
jgi:magnesium-transporting ATPase (P-type)